MRARLELRVASLHPDLHAALLADWSVTAWDASPRWLVVPGSTLGRALVRDAVRMHGAVFGAVPRTLTDVAAAAVAGDPARRRRLRAEAATWLVRELRHRGHRAPTTLDAALDVPGFRIALRRAFDDLARAGLSSRRDIERALVRHGFELPLAVRHLLELLLAYRNAFESTHDDRAALLVRAAAAPSGRFAALLAGSPLWMYGFTALDAPEMQLFERLCAEPGIELRVFVPRDGGGEADPPLAARVAAQAGAVVQRQPARDRHGPADLRIVAAPSAESEADEAARAVLRAAADGMRFESMAIQALDPRTLDLVAASLRRAGIPYHEQPGRALAATRCGRALLALLDVAAQGLRLEPVLAFLAMAPLRWSEWAEIDADPVPSAWERVAREAFVGTGRADWEQKLTRLAIEHETAAAELERESEPAVLARAAAAAARELVRVVVALDAALRMLPARGAWNEWVESTRRIVDALFVAGAERDAIDAALERLRALDGLGRTQPLRADFRDALRGVLADATLRAPHEPVAAVQVGAAGALWGAAFDFVCIVGLGEGEWPSPRRDDPVLSERVRAGLAAVVPDPALVPSPGARMAREREWFFDACAAARRRLVLLWARLDATTGATRLPSALLLDLAAARTRRRLDFVQFEQLPFVVRVPLRRVGVEHGEPALHRAEIETWIASALPAPAARSWVAGLDIAAARGVAIERLRAGAQRFTSADGWLANPAARAALAARMQGASLSATRLATYATCPFRYFWRYLLGVEALDRKDHRDLDALESGRLAHQVLERLYRDAAGAGVAVADLEDARLEAALDAALESVTAPLLSRGRTGSRLLWDVRRRRLRDDLGRFLRQDRVRAGVWRPRELELQFGRGMEMAPWFGTAVGRVWLRGSIDRIDTGPGAAAVRVVDYKTGQALRADRADPRAVQLAVYLWVACGGDARRLAQSEAVFASVTRRGGFARQRLAGARIEAGELERHVDAVVTGIARGELFAHPGPGAVHCRGCDYTRACEARVAPLAERKARGGQMAAFVALPDFGSRLDSDDEAVVP
jgi:hypothetical protein